MTNEKTARIVKLRGGKQMIIMKPERYEKEFNSTVNTHKPYIFDTYHYEVAIVRDAYWNLQGEVIHEF